MADFSQNVRTLSHAAWRVRWTCVDPKPCPFALALFTDDRRQMDILSLLTQLPTVRQIPPLAVIFRHDSLPKDKRRALAQTACVLTKSKGHYFLMARGELSGSDGSHGNWPDAISTPVHDWKEGYTAYLKGARIGFVSPIFATRSHPNASTLGVPRANAISGALPLAMFGLGGMTPPSARRLEGSHLQGIGAIGAFTD